MLLQQASKLNFAQQATIIITVGVIFIFLYNMPTLLRMRREWKQKKEGEKKDSTP